MAKTAFTAVSHGMLESIAIRFRALGEVRRLEIIQALQSGEKNVTRLVLLTGLSQPNVSRHLSVLLAAGLIGRRRDGNNVLYRIVDKTLMEICSIVCRSVSNQS